MQGLAEETFARQIRRVCVSYYDHHENSQEAREDIADKLEEMAGLIRSGDYHL